MSDTFIVAARLRLGKKQTTAWLRAAAGDASLIENPSETFLGYDWAGHAPLDLGRAPDAKQVKHRLGARAKRMHAGEPEALLATKRERCVWVYHTVNGYQEAAIASTLLAIAAAKDHRIAKAPDHALVLAETSGRLRPEAVLAVLEITRGRARFVDNCDVSAVVESLRPLEALFVEGLHLGLDALATDERFVHPQIRQAAKISKARNDPPTFDSLDALLHAARAAKSDNWGSFKRHIQSYAGQAAGFGAAAGERCQELMRDGSWEAGVIAYWGLCEISLRTGDPAHFTAAREVFEGWPPDKRRRGFVLGDAASLRKQHLARAGGGSPVASLVAELRADLELYREGGLRCQEDLTDILFFDYGAVAELSALRVVVGLEPIGPSDVALDALRRSRSEHPGLVFYWFFDPVEAQARLADATPVLHEALFPDA